MQIKKAALITAGGSGMGAEAARVLAGQGYLVAVLSSSGKGEELAKKLGGLGMTGSNQNPDDLRRFVEKTYSTFGRIDAVVNSAGHGPKGDILGLSDEEWHCGLEVYFLNVVRVCRLVTPIMENQSGGSIVNISSFATFEPDPNFPTSAAFRSSLAAFTKLFTDAYAPKHIRMNNILPGFIDSLPEQESFRCRIPMGRYGTVREIAETAAFLLSEAGGYITGQNIRVDGGLTRAV
ncbi:MAG: SDR family oxidoreductase [Desulfohalobiaceae bacterium]|nr:SDR family oxidoreductase [Desulfohalobiaceae bacterium]